MSENPRGGGTPPPPQLSLHPPNIPAPVPYRYRGFALLGVSGRVFGAFLAGFGVVGWVSGFGCLKSAYTILIVTVAGQAAFGV